MNRITMDVVIPALNEEKSLPKVLTSIPKGLVRKVVVCDNGSTDQTAKVAKEGGAVVVHEGRKGYGAACLKALELLEHDPPMIVVFLDADFSDDPTEMNKLVDPLAEGHVDFVLGSRTKGELQKGALTLQQRVGNAFACRVFRYFYKAEFSDLGPFRAIRWETLKSLDMGDLDYGWTVEMQIKVAQKKIKYLEVPVTYRKRIGISKVSGTVRGTLGASKKILWLLWKYR